MQAVFGRSAADARARRQEWRYVLHHDLSGYLPALDPEGLTANEKKSSVNLRRLPAAIFFSDNLQ
jgi:hypothetical protein